MTLFGRFLIGLLLATTLTASCTDSPAQRVHRAVADLCADPAAFGDHLTPASRRFWDGLRRLQPDAFACPADAAVTVTDTGVNQPALRVFRVGAGDERTEVAVVRHEGAWKIDLFRSEDGLFHLMEPEP